VRHLHRHRRDGVGFGNGNGLLNGLYHPILVESLKLVYHLKEALSVERRPKILSCFPKIVIEASFLRLF
jgi:hypothetical protein